LHGCARRSLGWRWGKRVWGCEDMPAQAGLGVTARKTRLASPPCSGGGKRQAELPKSGTDTSGGNPQGAGQGRLGTTCALRPVHLGGLAWPATLYWSPASIFVSSLSNPNCSLAFPILPQDPGEFDRVSCDAHDVHLVRGDSTNAATGWNGDRSISEPGRSAGGNLRARQSAPAGSPAGNVNRQPPKHLGSWQDAISLAQERRKPAV
jgi:hypothetical protein